MALNLSAFGIKDKATEGLNLSAFGISPTATPVATKPSFSDIVGSQDMRMAQTTPTLPTPEDVGMARLPFSKEPSVIPGGKIPALAVGLLTSLPEVVIKTGVRALAQAKESGFLAKGEATPEGYKIKPEPLDLSFGDIGKRIGFDSNKIQTVGNSFMEEFTKRQQTAPDDLSHKTFLKNFGISFGKEVILPILDAFVAGSIGTTLAKTALRATTRDPITQFAIKELRLQPSEITDPEVIRYAFNRQWETIIGRGGSSQELNRLGQATGHLYNKVLGGEEIQGLNKLGEIVQKTARTFLSDMSLVTNRLPMGLSIEDVSKQLPAKIEEAGKLMEQIKQVGGDIQKAQGIVNEIAKTALNSTLNTLTENYLEQLKTMAKPLAQEVEIKRVSDNLLKNNPGITQKDAEAMARDVIENRKFNQATAPQRAITAVDDTLQEARKYKSAEDYLTSKTITTNGIKHLDPKEYSNFTSFVRDIEKLNDGTRPVDEIKLAEKLWGNRPKQVVESINPKSIVLAEEPLKVLPKAGRQVTEPITVEVIDGVPTLVDGRHRLAQAIANGQETIPAKISGGSKVQKITDTYYQELIKTKSQLTDFWKEANKKIPQISQVDKLIAENKIRIVSRNGRDVYMYKKGDEWKMAQNETQAIERAIVEPKQKEVIFNPEMEDLLTHMAIAEDTIDQMPGKELIKYVSKTTGQLPEVTGKDTMQSLTGSGKIVKNSEFGKKGDQIAQEILGYENSPSVADAQKAIDDYVKAKEKIIEAKKRISEIKQEMKTEIKPPEIISLPKKAPLIAKSEGEVRSIEEQAEQALNAVDEPYRDKVFSLTEIIKQTSTNVKQKVNILDYLRTPEKVLEKIGFAKEAKMIRQGYEAYLKELPKNIDKITKWVNQVPKESNERIFRYLDGKAIDLTEIEKKIALEIKDWLKQWADRLKLPEDNRITNYITHIFDRELVAKEFDEDLAKIITDKLPGEIYNPFLLKRLGIKGFKQDTWQALDAYVKRATRKANMDNALDALKNKAGSSLEMSNIEASQFKYIQRYVSHINMRPTELDNLLDNSIKSIVGYKYGQRPITVLTKLLRQMTFRGMLGFNMTSALRNISQGINTYAVLGEKYTMIGYAKLFQSGALKELEEQGILNVGFIQDKTLSSTKKTIEKIDKTLFFFFDTAEKINRGSAYFGAKAKAIKDGKTLDQAIEYAKNIVRKTQFSFGSIDTPVALQSDIAKTLSQFQTYTIKQIEFLAGMAKDKNFIGLLRYIISGLIFTYTIGSTFGMKPEQLIPNFRFDIPPSLKFPVETIKAILGTPDKYGRNRDISKKIEDVLKSLVGLIPAGTQIKKTYEGTKAIQQGGSFDKGGRLQFKQGQSIPEEAQSLIFGKYASEEAQNYFNKNGKKPSKYSQ